MKPAKPPDVTKLEDRKKVKGLIKALAYQADSDVRKYAAMALNRIGDGRAVSALIAALKDPHGGVRYHAASALGRIGDARAVDALILLLSGGDFSDKEVAIEALGAIGDKRAVEPLIAASNKRGWASLTAKALAKLGDPAAVAPLLASLQSDFSHDRWSAAEALVKIGDAGIKEQVFAILKAKEDITDEAATGTAKKVELLLMAGVDVDTKTSGGYTPLLIAAARGKTDMVKILLDAGADVNARGTSNKTAYQLARENGYTATANLIQTFIDAQSRSSASTAKEQTAHAEKLLPSGFIDNGNGTVYDKETGLVWQQAEDAIQRKYEDALSYCRTLELAGRSDWRLPSKEELAGLASMESEALEQIFPNIRKERYWAHTSADELAWADAPDRIAYTVDFDRGSGNFGKPVTYFRKYEYYVRAVRNI
jgi:hypothetical protein